MQRKRNGELNQFYCARCGKIYKTSDEFYRSNSDVYSDSGHIPICKTCCVKLFQSYIEKYNDQKKAVKRFCMTFDLYYNDTAYDTCCNATIDAVIGTYMKRLNITQYRQKTFSDSLAEGFSFEELSRKKIKPKKDDENKPEIIVTQEDIEQWGGGLDPEDYEILNSHYKYLKDANPNCDSNQEIFINELCYTKMQQMKAVRNNKVDDYNKLTESYRKSFMQAGIKTVKDNAADADFTLGVTAEMIEKYTPAEYYKNKQLFKDNDGIGEYIDRFLLRPIKNLMHGDNKRDPEYYVKGDDENNFDES